MIAEIDGDLARDAATTLGEAALGVQCDVSQAADVERAFDACLERFGRIDILVNNAAVVGPAVRHFLELDEETWDLVLAVNLKGHYLCTRRAADHMVEQGSGVVINVSSGGASRAHRGMVAYDASKGGVEAFTRAVAVDLAPYGVRCACIVPGLMEGGTAERRRPRAGQRRDGAARPPGHRRRHRRSGRVPRGRGRELPHRIVPLRGRRRAPPAALAAGRDLPAKTLSARRPPGLTPSEGGYRKPRFAPFLRMSRVSRSRRERVPTIRGRPQLLHDLSIRLYMMLQRDRGQTMAEYAVVLAVIAIGIFVALGSLRGSIGGALGKVTSDI